MQTRKSLFSAPGRTILLSMIATIFVGSLLLWSSWSHHGQISYLDALFTATSATCVTGLLTVPLTQFTPLGQVVIMFLMQIGALGLISLTVFLLSLFMNLGLTATHMTEEILEVGGSRRARDMLFFIMVFTGIVEAIGFFAIFFTIKKYYPVGKAAFYALFHTVSSFCNAGFVIFSSESQVSHLIVDHRNLMIITALLVLIGGLGFMVWHEVVKYFRSWSSHKHFHFSLHSKIVFSMTVFLITFMSVMVFILEYLKQFMVHPSLWYVMAAVFDGICLRSAGFTTIDFSTIHLATLFTIMIVSFIGSSPGSTGGGIKTTTFATFLAAIRATLSRRIWVEIKQRTLANEQIFKAMAIFSLSLCWLAATIFLLLLTEQGWRFIDICSEAFAAFTNLGLSTGITPYLSEHGKIVIMLSMLIGRIGSLTLLLAFKKQQAKSGLHYPEERILMG